jgi:hypothetical protein
MRHFGIGAFLRIVPERFEHLPMLAPFLGADTQRCLVQPAQEAAVQLRQARPVGFGSVGHFDAPFGE